MNQTETNTLDADGNNANAYSADAYNADEWGQYRSLSTLAVIALVLGLASAAIFAGPLLMVVPLAAVAIALLALKGIAASEGGLSGARLARLGLVLAILFSVASVARVKVRDTLLERQADSVGRQWLSLAAEGRIEDMLSHMSKDAVDKVAPTEGVSQLSLFGSMFATALLRQEPLVVFMSEMEEASKASIQLTDASVNLGAKPPQAVFRYLLSGPESVQQPCLMVLKRFQATPAEVVWLVDSWKLE